MGNRPRPINMTDIESILEKNADIEYAEKWHPTLVSRFESELTRGAFCGMKKELKKNIAYSLQYLEFIQLQFAEVHLHDVVAMHLTKTYIITAMGIIEGLFFHLITSKGYQKKTEWEVHGKPIHTNVFLDDGTSKKYVVSEERKLETPLDVQMDFEFLINKVQEKELIALTGKAFPYIKALKRLRNKVHLHIIRYENDTDYLSIDYYDYVLMRYILYKVLRDEVFCPQSQTYLSFIMPDEKQMASLNAHLKEKHEEETTNG